MGLLGVLLGAFAAHGLKPLLIANGTVDIWQTAVFYQFVHALALLAVGQQPNLRLSTVMCWGIGVALFSGSLYFLALDPTQRWIGPVTPIGGTALIVGWGSLLYSLFTGKKNS